MITDKFAKTVTQCGRYRDEIPGLSLRVQIKNYSGRQFISRAWILKWSEKGRGRRIVYIGSAHKLTVKQARERALRVRAGDALLSLKRENELKELARRLTKVLPESLSVEEWTYVWEEMARIK
ncbi:MAG: DUF4102 domain-containing protein [Candidatus Obscuribacter sp.]|nr:DUF4102 domain-containing protein [Candidatus Obscuribacter sp.]